MGGIEKLEVLYRLKDRLLGTCDTLEGVLELLEIDMEIDEGDLLDVNIELCTGCGWWHESNQLIDDDGEVVGCDDCRK